MNPFKETRSKSNRRKAIGSDFANKVDEKLMDGVEAVNKPDPGREG